jgi:hypothetical protein
LAHLGGLRRAADSSRAQASQRHRFGRTRLEEHRLCVRRNHDRSVREIETRSIQRCRERQDTHTLDQQLCLANIDDRSALHEPLISRIVFHMDQAKPENQEIPWQ